MANKFYLTTPIYYVNARPHIGHAYSTIAADVIARRHRLLGEDVFFLTGTDEHGQKVQRSAAAAGIPPQQFTDQVSASFSNLWKRMGITNNDFIRTTDPRHKRGVQKLWQDLEARGAIYLSTYTGQYSVGEEMFIDGPPGTLGPDGKPTETVTEENYFFRLSDYQLPIIDLIESNTLQIQPEAIRNEVLSFLRGGLNDLSISRTTFDWGIPIPGNPKHVVYVWLDALANYLTAIGYGSDAPADIAKFNRYWPADLHLVGKEITRFHCVYWPAFLLALNPETPTELGAPRLASETGVPSGPQLSLEQHRAWATKMLPKSVVANGWLLFEESKMSKSRGNVVRTETILDAFGNLVYASVFPNSTHAEQDLFAADVLRYFLLREIPFGQDGSFSFDALITRYNADLANGYGNLVSRTLTLVQKGLGSEFQGSYDGGFAYGTVGLGEDQLIGKPFEWTLGVWSQTWTNERWEASPTLEATAATHFESMRFGQATEALWQAIRFVDNFLSTSAPWKLIGSTENGAFETLDKILYIAAESIRIITALLYPILPYATASVWAQLGLGSIEEAAKNGDLKNLQWGGLKPGTKLGPLSPIFPRADKGLAQIMTDLESPPPPPPTPANPESVLSAKSAVGPSPSETTEATIDDFTKIDLRVAQIVVAERIPKADKLLRLEVDLGPDHPRRQILSGIAEWYTPEELIGRRVAIIANLAPRKMRGLESHGMLLAASGTDHTKPILATFSDEVPLGSRIK
jgi:methionyl-tRNA synthetase